MRGQDRPPRGGAGDDDVAGEAAVLSGGPRNDSVIAFTDPLGIPRSLQCGDGVDMASSWYHDDVFSDDCETVRISLFVSDGGTLVSTPYNDGYDRIYAYRIDVIADDCELVDYRD